MKLKQFLEVYDGKDDLNIIQFEELDSDGTMASKSELLQNPEYQYYLDLNVYDISLGDDCICIIVIEFDSDKSIDSRSYVNVMDLIETCGFQTSRHYLFCLYKNDWDIENYPLGQASNNAMRHVYLNHQVIGVKFDIWSRRVYIKIKMEDD